MQPSQKPSALAAQLEILGALDEEIGALVSRHESTRKHWHPGDLVDFGNDTQLADLRRLRERAASLPATVKVAVMLNLLTEEGLPHFHRLISEHLGMLSVWTRWTRLWTAEEDRHGNVLRDYARDAALYEPAALDRMQFAYLNSGFDPEWAGSPFRLLAYTSLQERATQAAHANTGRLAATQEPLLQRVLAHLAGDEARHCAFYRDAFALALEADADHALLELAQVAPKLSMPGETIPGYLMMADVEREAGIFGPREYAALVGESVDYWDLGHCEPATGAARAARDGLMALPARLTRLADHLSHRRRQKTYEPDFLRHPAEAIA